MRNRGLLAAFICGASLHLAGCAPFGPQLRSNDPLVGCWYGEDYQPVFQRRAGWLMNRRADGTFTIEFRTVERGVSLPIQTEEGRWTHDNGQYTTFTTKVAGEEIDKTDPHYTDTYEVRSVNDVEMTYYHPGVKQTFRSKRVDCDYKAP